MIIDERVHYLGVMIMSLNIQTPSNDFNFSDDHGYKVVKCRRIFGPTFYLNWVKRGRFCVALCLDIFFQSDPYRLF